MVAENWGILRLVKVYANIIVAENCGILRLVKMISSPRPKCTQFICVIIWAVQLYNVDQIHFDFGKSVNLPTKMDSMLVDDKLSVKLCIKTLTRLSSSDDSQSVTKSSEIKNLYTNSLSKGGVEPVSYLSSIASNHNQFITFPNNAMNWLLPILILRDQILPFSKPHYKMSETLVRHFFPSR